LDAAHRKSVLLKLIIGLLQPDSGSIRIHGQDIAGLTLDQLGEIRKKIGFSVSSRPRFYDSLTVGTERGFSTAA